MNDKPNKLGSKLIIMGVTENGEPFRPSDWAERMSGALSSFRNHRIYYSPLLRPSIQNGNTCLILDKVIKESNPALYSHILEFAHKNKLKILGEENAD
jgi:hypothetical protein